MADRRTSHPVVLQRFTEPADSVDSATLRAEVRAYAHSRANRKGCESWATLRSAGGTGSYLHLEQWAGLEALLRAAHDDAQGPRLRRLESMADCRYDLAVSVGRMAVAGPLADAAGVLLMRCVTEAGPAAFEVAMGSLIGQCVSAEGYGGSDLLRSLVAPRAYTALLWWRDEESCRRALEGSGYRAHRERLQNAGALVEERVMRPAGA